MRKSFLTKISVAALVTVFAVSAAFSQEQFVKVKVENSVLRGEYGEIKCPKGTVLKVIEKSEGGYRVSGEIFGMNVEGSISAADVDIVGEPPSEESAETDVAEQTQEPAEKPKIELKAVTYLGKILPPDFIEYFYGKVKEGYCLKNINSDELIPKKDFKTISNAVDCEKLSPGSIVAIEGTLKLESGKLFLIGISGRDPSQRFANNVVVFKKNQVRGFQPNWEWKRNFKIIAVYGSEKKMPEFQNPELQPSGFNFEEILPDDMFYTVEKFAKTLEAGTEYTIPCPNCERKGKKGRELCTQCGRSGKLSGAKAVDKLIKEFKKQAPPPSGK